MLASTEENVLVVRHYGYVTPVSGGKRITMNTSQEPRKINTLPNKAKPKI